MCVHWHNFRTTLTFKILMGWHHSGNQILFYFQNLWLLSFLLKAGNYLKFFICFFFHSSNRTVRAKIADSVLSFLCLFSKIRLSSATAFVNHLILPIRLSKETLFEQWITNPYKNNRQRVLGLFDILFVLFVNLSYFYYC